MLRKVIPILVWDWSYLRGRSYKTSAQYHEKLTPSLIVRNSSTPPHPFSCGHTITFKNSMLLHQKSADVRAWSTPLVRKMFALDPPPLLRTSYVLWTGPYVSETPAFWFGIGAISTGSCKLGLFGWLSLLVFVPTASGQWSNPCGICQEPGQRSFSFYNRNVVFLFITAAVSLTNRCQLIFWRSRRGGVTWEN